MNPLHPTFIRRCLPQRTNHDGFTLLEVLVSMGIIVAALAGIAALLPATGSRLAEATETDRAGTMAANARADLANRRLVAVDLWPASTRVVVFGEGLPALPPLNPAVAAAVPTEVSRRIDTSSGFFLSDEVTSTGNNALISGTARKICYGCMLSGTGAAAPARGEQVIATTVVFRSPGPSVKAFTLAQTGAGSSVFTIDSGAATEADRKRFLAGCAWVFVVGSSGTSCWLPIASSWKTYVPGATSGTPTGTAYVSLTAGTSVLANLGSPLQAYGFEGLLRVDERLIPLE